MSRGARTFSVLMRASAAVAVSVAGSRCGVATRQAPLRRHFSEQGLEPPAGIGDDVP